MAPLGSCFYYCTRSQRHGRLDRAAHALLKRLFRDPVAAALQQHAAALPVVAALDVAHARLRALNGA